MARIGLPSGGWAEMRDAETLRKRDRDAVLRRMGDLAGPNASEMALGLAGNDAVMIELIDAWSFETPIPREGGDLGDLTIGDASMLDKAAEAMFKALFPNFDPTPDRASPTQPSSV